MLILNAVATEQIMETVLAIVGGVFTLILAGAGIFVGVWKWLNKQWEKRWQDTVGAQTEICNARRTEIDTIKTRLDKQDQTDAVLLEASFHTLDGLEMASHGKPTNGTTGKMKRRLVKHLTNYPQHTPVMPMEELEEID